MSEDAKSERLVSKTGEGGAVPSTHAILCEYCSEPMYYVPSLDYICNNEKCTATPMDRLRDLFRKHDSNLNGVCCE